MSYIDCYLVAVPRENRSAYEELARISAVVLKECGALRALECWLDESGPDASSYHATEARLEPKDYITFVSAVGAREGETVVISYVEWPNKEMRDVGMQKLASDPRMLFEDRPPVFDGRRLIAGGFVPMPGFDSEA